MKRTLTEKKEYFSNLYDQSFDYVYSYIFARTAGGSGLTEEIVQEAFACAWQSFDRFSGKCSFGTWVCAIAKNKLCEHYRRELRKGAHELAVNGEFDKAESSADVEKSVLSNENRQAVIDVLAKIPEHYRYVLVLKYLDGMTMKQIAKVAGKTPKAVDGVIQRAKAAFEKEYSDMESRD